MTKPRSWILSCALVLTALVPIAGCGGSGSSRPPLPLGEDNASSVAAEALISSRQDSFTVQLPDGIATGVAAVVRSLAPDAVRRLATLAAGPQSADGTMTEACPGGGSQTITTAGTTATTVFDHCVRGDATRVDGTVKLAVQLSTGDSNQLTMSATLEVTVTQGALSLTESGGYDLVLRTAANPTDDTEFELRGDSLRIALSVGGTLRDELALSSFDIVLSQQLTSTGEDVEHFAYEIDSSRLEGHIGVMTTQDLEQHADVLLPTQYAFAGQIVVSGANHTRLRITILGDETFTPPAGKGQIELEVDPGTGTFGAPTWTSWAALSAMVMN